ncbi:hypothetical protein AXJ14_gp018 [Geobacillus virus E3]|uniref:hypothetical protein n=1 Tax=Geobacillus virus E3 TaxID=1572712 RepID=UPI00067184C1|nr:hypothetical protein AXJ14_gp018 [Geobacillus virus E3]AJA41337.1 hypothetical protein E3_018 [Geobacillus virus E3]
MKYKVFNNNRFNVGIRFENEANREILIKPNSFVLMSEDDILYVDTVSKLFSKGILYVEDEELMIKMGYMEKNPNTISEDEIRKILKMPNNKMKEALSKLDAKHAIDKVIAVAKESDLPQSKLKIIKELFNVEIFEEIDQEIV